VVPACGAYFGEVVRRHLVDGEWECPEDDYQSWCLSLLSGLVRFNPVGVALEVAVEEEAAGWDAHYAVAEPHKERARDAVDVLGEVAEVHYYSFTARFEVVEQIHVALTRHLAAKS